MVVLGEKSVTAARMAKYAGFFNRSICYSVGWYCQRASRCMTRRPLLLSLIFCMTRHATVVYLVS